MRVNMFKSHYNRALGKKVYTKDDYLSEMKKQGMVPQKEAEQMVKEFEKRKHTYDKPSEGAMDLMNCISNKRKDKNGKIKLSDREIDQMKKIGVNFTPRQGVYNALR